MQCNVKNKNVPFRPPQSRVETSMCTEVSMEEIIPKKITSAFYQHKTRNESWMLAVWHLRASRREPDNKYISLREHNRLLVIWVHHLQGPTGMPLEFIQPQHASLVVCDISRIKPPGAKSSELTTHCPIHKNCIHPGCAAEGRERKNGGRREEGLALTGRLCSKGQKFQGRQ